jgi:hypothetical protein
LGTKTATMHLNHQHNSAAATNSSREPRCAYTELGTHETTPYHTPRPIAPRDGADHPANFCRRRRFVAENETDATDECNFHGARIHSLADTGRVSRAGNGSPNHFAIPANHHFSTPTGLAPARPRRLRSRTWKGIPSPSRSGPASHSSSP